ncbi:MAG: hypothetical protein KKE02_18665 [Alphaproteobacteria bacterium]|nr:hypothetical protein [Alphaproteobacteria bacterium]MBU1514308.1 hypothetical protein [Alphaproteobacteria bacterium]MBU2095952.1 hypothetical protein [Alphaproteobacteria bacterium]MBU2153050.1 hypothetical protein [Alphaproteobacteria bacterium]MBU2308507.1 hypothetical protein [Alphaproteobacteria bacterium]
MPQHHHPIFTALSRLAAVFGAGSGPTALAASRWRGEWIRPSCLAGLEAGGVGYWELDLPGMTLEVSGQGKRLLGRNADAPFGLADLAALLPAGDDRLTLAVADGGAYAEDFRLPALNDDGRWVCIRGRLVGGEGGERQRMAGVILDITERQEAVAHVVDSDRRQRLLIDELNHRVKNTLAAVQSISRQSAKRAGSLDDFRELFEARLIALSQTHNALTRQSWERAHLDELLGQQLGPYPSEQVRLDGPAVDLAPREALALGMVFHELATNAAKYGALSTPDGRVRVSWDVIPGGVGAELLMDWAESGGPPVTAPARRGFGIRMIQGSVMGELGGSADLGFEPDGFRAKLSIPLDFGRDGVGDEPNMKPGVQHGFSAARAK